MSQIPDKAKLAADTIGAERLGILRTTGLLAIKLPSKRERVYDTLYWGKKLGADAHADVTWYIDGSQLFPRRRELSTLGFALAAVSGDGELLAWGWGAPPKWCDSASAAEAWALCTVLRHAAPQDRIVTDCLGLLKTARAGKAAATTAKKSLARTWNLITHHMDGRVDKLAMARRLTWMPAHQTPAAIGNALKSSGAPITASDWRANHLVDGLAKLAAGNEATTSQEARLVSSAEHLVRHCAGQLATATHNANNCIERYLDGKSEWKARTKRDSQEFPKTATKKLQPLKALTLAPVVPPAEPPPVESSDSDSQQHANRSQRSRTARLTAKKKEAAVKHQALQLIVSAKRLNQREAAVDQHRRQQLFKSSGLAASESEGHDWGSFLNLQEDPLTAETVAESQSAGAPQEAYLEGTCGQSTPSLQHAAFPLSCSQLEPVSRSSRVELVQRSSRDRPNRGSSKFTAASSRAAVNSLVG